jgi:hypothetical protein
MRLPSRFSIILLLLILTSMCCSSLPRAAGSYAGDKPLSTFAHDELRGALLFTLGDSQYSGQVHYNETYTVAFDLRGLQSKDVRLGRLYVYWVWSQKENVGVYPTMRMADDGGVLEPEASYTDTKGFVGQYDYYSGVTVYTCTEPLGTAPEGLERYEVAVTNADPDGSTFSVQGIGLLVVCECPERDSTCPVIEYWINEGCDMIYAEYGITPEMATSTSYFEGELDPKNMEKATLITVVPSGGYAASGEQASHTLYFNEESGWLKELPFLKQLLRLLFSFGGGVWHDVYIADNTVQIGVDQRDVTEYLKASNNFAAIQDNHDYMMVTNAVLVVEKRAERD